MIFLKKTTAPSAIFAKPHAVPGGPAFTAPLLTGVRKIEKPWLFSSFGMLCLVASFACLLTFAVPGSGLAQTAQNELKATVLPPNNTKEQPKNTPEKSTNSPLESNSAMPTGQEAGQEAGEEAGQEVSGESIEVSEEILQESSGASNNNATVNATVNATGSASMGASSNATGTAQLTGTSGMSKATNATGSGQSGSTQAGSLNSMGDDEYFKVAPKEEEAFSWSGYFVAVGGLLLVLAVLWMMVWLLRKRGAFPGASLMNRNAFKIEATLPLGPKRCLMLVRFLNSRYLLGVTDQQITLIKELEEQDAQGNQSSKTVASSGSTAAHPGNRADVKASGNPAASSEPLDFAQALHEESQKNDGKLQL